MPSLTIKPPQPPQSTNKSSTNGGSSSPVAPEYSPITPKVQPALPAVLPQHDAPQVPPVPPANDAHTAMMEEQMKEGNGTSKQEYPLGLRDSDEAGIAPAAPAPSSAMPETQYIPQPPSLPFSSEESGDAIALRAAISSLQFQKQKAAQDLITLEALKKQALADPERFRDELVAGRLKEQRPDFGSLRDILDAPAEDGDDEDEVMLGAQDEEYGEQRQAEVPDSQPGSFSANHPSSSSKSSSSPFPRIPGPQDVVRMPPINWDKYNVVGEALNALHEQQRRWPGSAPGQEHKGREHAVAAPYSPFYDTLEGARAANLGPSNASNGFLQSDSAMHSPSATGTISEHPMETRRSSKNQP